MFTSGDDFTYELDGELLDYTCIDVVNVNEEEYVVAENEEGYKKVFLIEDEENEDISMVEEEDEEIILDIFERQQGITNLYLNDDDMVELDENDSHYENDEFDDFIIEDIDELIDEEDVEIDEDDINDLLDELFEDEKY